MRCEASSSDAYNNSLFFITRIGTDGYPKQVNRLVCPPVPCQSLTQGRLRSLPFVSNFVDIVKVRLQTTQQYKSALDCATQIWKHEGPSAFYKGTLTPLVGIGACVSVQFGAFHAARRAFEARNVDANPQSPPSLSYVQYYSAGALAGVTNSVISGPIEHVRIRLQTQPHSPRLYAGPLSCIRTLASRGGVGRGLFRGQAVTMLREAQAYGCWFLTYEYLMNWDVKRRGSGARRADVEAWKLALYGGIAGEMLWLASYPLDVVKSKMQTDGLGFSQGNNNASLSSKNKAGVETAEGSAPAKLTAEEKYLGPQRYSTMRACFAQTFREEGFAGFWRGIGPTLLRAMPVSAATFVV